MLFTSSYWILCNCLKNIYGALRPENTLQINSHQKETTIQAGTALHWKSLYSVGALFQALSRSAPTLDRKPSLTWGLTLRGLVGKFLVSLPVKQTDILRWSQWTPLQHKTCVASVAYKFSACDSYPLAIQLTPDNSKGNPCANSNQSQFPLDFLHRFSVILPYITRTSR